MAFAAGIKRRKERKKAVSSAFPPLSATYLSPSRAWLCSSLVLCFLSRPPTYCTQYPPKPPSTTSPRVFHLSLVPLPLIFHDLLPPLSMYCTVHGTISRRETETGLTPPGSLLELSQPRSASASSSSSPVKERSAVRASGLFPRRRGSCRVCTASFRPSLTRASQSVRLLPANNTEKEKK